MTWKTRKLQLWLKSGNKEKIK
ncbi:hypothetical protein NXF25_020113 [Crotalus adamanteus]|uniref:Uncharacterized protein n=1 Tax=Crotalus adamanteus TaxID=8729 RepID=A0AAW1B3X3_CROAD